MATTSKNIQMKIQDENSNWILLYPKTKAECVEGLEDLDFGNIQEQINNINKELEELKYVAISITSFNANKSNIELGSTVSDVVLTWNTNKSPEHQYINNVEISNSTKTYSYSTSFNLNKTFTLKVTDSKGATATKSVSINFLNGAYYGASSSTNYNNDFILSFTKVLTNSKNRNITVNAGEGQYIFYCIPTRFGTCNFTVNGFSGGFSLVSTINFTNSSGYTENYDIWKSTNSNLGNTNVSIT